MSSWGVSRIRRLGVMTIPAPEPDPGSSQRASNASAGGGGRVASRRGELRLVTAAGGARRLRAAAPVQLELVSGRDGSGPEVVWASLPEQAREQVLVLLARMIDSGAVAEDGAI
ncbi:MAG: hypothetical protein ACXVRN_14325 [Solirubrobacteraceae bacterium]